MARNILLTPGPTQIPPDICAALGRPIIHHRTAQFQLIIKEVLEGLQYVLRTKNDIHLLTCSGTGGMEACVSNLVSPGDKVITVESGKFGERWTELALVYGTKPTVIEVPWGQAVDPKQIAAHLKKDPEIRVVFTTLCETSTGVTHDIKRIAEVVAKTNAVLVVDGISGIGVTEFRTDDWQVDVVVAASHKGFMLPPGLAFVAANAKAQKFIDQAKSPRYYFDLRKSREALKKTDTPFTSAIGIVVAMAESLKYFKKIGLDNQLARIAQLAQGTRAAAKALGLTLLAQDSCISNVLTPINLPASIDGEKLVKTLRDVHGISMAEGQGHLKGKLIRIAHMGCVSAEDLSTGISYLAKVLAEMGYKCDEKAALKAAQNIFKS